MTLNYYVYTQGGTIQRALNAVAAFFQSASFESMTSIALMIGAVMTMAYFYATRNPRYLYVWAIVFTLVPSLLIQSTVRLQIIDKTEPRSVYAVDNVPYLVALPTWLFSTLMMGVTESVESIFSASDDERYGRTGMMFGSQLYQLSRQANLNAVRQRELWDGFFRSCIVGDIEINHKYTWDALLETADIFAFLGQHRMSPLRGVMSNVKTQDFKTCQVVFVELKHLFDEASKEELALLGTYLNSNKANMYDTHVRQALENSYQTLIGVSNNAATILRQNMAMNAVRQSIDGLSNHSASAVNYAYTSNKMQQTSMWATLGLQAREFIPMMHTMLFFLFSCLSFMIAAAALVPALTMMVLTNYLKTFAYLATWPPLFAILNALMLWGLETTSSATAQPMHGLSLSNANALDELHVRFGYMAGFLMMAVPVLAGKILQGGIAAAQAMNYQLVNMINSTNARVSAASSTGNVDFGNLQLQNHSFNNTSGNKLDDNLLIKSGLTTVQQPDGALVTTLENNGGHRLYNAQEAISKPVWQAQISHMAQSSLSDQYSQALTTQKQHMNAYSESYQTSVQQSDRWNDSWSQNASYGDTHSATTDGQIVRAHSQMESAIDSLSQTMGWTHDQARAYATAANAGLSIGTPGQALLGSGLRTGVSWSTDQRNAYQAMTAEQRQALAQSLDQYNQGATAMERAGRTIDTRENHTEAEQYAHDFALNHQRLKQTAVSVQESNANVESLQTIESRLHSDTLGFSSNVVAGFQSYLESTVIDGSDVTRLMTATRPDDLREVQWRFEQYARSDAFEQAFGHQATRHPYQEFAAMYQPTPLSEPATLSPEQHQLVERGATKTKADVDEVTTDLIHYQGSDTLYQGDVYRQVRGNVSVAGGYAQNDAEQPVSQTTDPHSTLRQNVEEAQLPSRETSAKPNPISENDYHLHDSNHKK